MLAVITPGDEAAALAGFAGLMSIARAAGAEVRVAVDSIRAISVSVSATMRS